MSLAKRALEKINNKKHKNEVIKMSKQKTPKQEPTVENTSVPTEEPVTQELLALVTTVVDSKTGKTSYVAKSAEGVDYTDSIDQKKLKYAFINKGVVRGREKAGSVTWRVVKEKFVFRANVDPNEVTVAPKKSKASKEPISA